MISKLTALDEANSIIFGDTWNSSVSVSSAHSTDRGAAQDLITTETVVDGSTTQVNVTYNTDSPETDKGIVSLSGDAHNLTNYMANVILQFDLLVRDYAANKDGLVVKMEGAESGPDYLLPGIPEGKWITVSVPINKLLTDKIIKNVTKPFVILPVWANSQAGVAFSFKNVRLIK